MRRIALFFSLILLTLESASAQDAMTLVKKLKAKLDKIQDYEASGILKTDVSFIKIPISNVEIYYKRPDHFKIKKEGGISILPKGGVSVNIISLLESDQFAAVSAGNARIGNTPVSVVKLIPLSEDAHIVLTTLYIDETNLLVLKAITTTKENGTYEMEMTYGKYAASGLPDKVIFIFSTRDYKLPKGVTFEYEGAEKPQTTDEKTQEKKGKIQITYNSYAINKGISDKIFE